MQGSNWLIDLNFYYSFNHMFVDGLYYEKAAVIYSSDIVLVGLYIQLTFTVHFSLNVIFYVNAIEF